MEEDDFVVTNDMRIPTNDIGVSTNDTTRSTNDMMLERNNRTAVRTSGSTIVDLTTDASIQSLSGTSNPNVFPLDDAPFLFIHTEQVEDSRAPIPSSNLFPDEGINNQGNDPIPSSNRFSSDDSTRARLPSSNRFGSDGSSRGDLPSAKSTSYSTQSVSWGETVSTTNSRNKYFVFEMPSDPDEFDIICKRKISNGTTMCIRKNCNINHRGGEVADVEEGYILVQKSTDVVFLELLTHRRNVTDEVLIEWIGEKRKISEWVSDFALANASDHNHVLSPLDITQGTAFVDLARTHKSPQGASETYSTFVGLSSALTSLGGESAFLGRKKKQTYPDDDDSRRSLGDEFAENLDSTNTGEVKDLIDHIFKTLELLVLKLDQKDGSFTEEVNILFSRIELLQTDVGTRSTNRVDSLEVPTLWGSIAVISVTIDDIRKELTAMPTAQSMRNVLQVDLDRIEAQTNKTVDIILNDLEEKVALFLQARGQLQKDTDDALELLNRKVGLCNDKLESNKR